jgi:DNA-binding transcriptional ArsR family regulator
LEKALGHPTRRRVLRRLHAEAGSPGSLEVARALHLSLPTAAYHMRVLLLCGAARLVEGPPGSASVSYEYQVGDHRWVAAQLAATEAEDETIARRGPALGAQVGGYRAPTGGGPPPGPWSGAGRTDVELRNGGGD